jgi:two-component system LytT family response regulator
MSSINALIIDDEFAAAENINILLDSYCPEITVVGKANSITQGIKMIKQLKPNLIFLDISMPPEGTGFDLLDTFPVRDFHVIFVTAYDKYSLQAIKEHAFDYLLKPIDYKELIRSVNDFVIQFSLGKPIENKESVITLATDEGIHVIHPQEILFCKASGSYTEFHIQNKPTIVISKSLKFAESILVTSNFKRVHRSYLINSKSITKLTKEDGGYVYINEVAIPVSKNYFENLYQILE